MNDILECLLWKRGRKGCVWFMVSCGRVVSVKVPLCRYSMLCRMSLTNNRGDLHRIRAHAEPVTAPVTYESTFTLYNMLRPNGKINSGKNWFALFVLWCPFVTVWYQGLLHFLSFPQAHERKRAKRIDGWLDESPVTSSHFQFGPAWGPKAAKRVLKGDRPS